MPRVFSVGRADPLEPTQAVPFPRLGRLSVAFPLAPTDPEGAEKSPPWEEQEDLFLWAQPVIYRGTCP